MLALLKKLFVAENFKYHRSFTRATEVGYHHQFFLFKLIDVKLTQMKMNT